MKSKFSLALSFRQGLAKDQVDLARNSGVQAALRIECFIRPIYDQIYYKTISCKVNFY